MFIKIKKGTKKDESNQSKKKELSNQMNIYLILTSILCLFIYENAYSGERLFVTFENSDTVSVIYTDMNFFDYSIEVGSKPEGMMVNNDGTNLYVAKA